MISVFDLYSIGIGPSSSHTVGPMRAAYRFVTLLAEKYGLASIGRVQVELFGSLALTGVGHGTDVAILLGLSGYLPEQVDPDGAKPLVANIRASKQLQLKQSVTLPFEEKTDLIFHKDRFLVEHANGMAFSAYDVEGNRYLEKRYFSVGGGFVVADDELNQPVVDESALKKVPYPFSDAKTLLEHCQKTGRSIAELVVCNERIALSQAEIEQRLLNIWSVMSACIDRGCQHPGILPGGLKVKRRAPVLYEKLTAIGQEKRDEMNWLSLFALAVNEENAAGGRVVTAPTNGAAGIIPAVLKYAIQFHRLSDRQVCEFLVTAGAMGILFKMGASISAAEVGCQGEVGVACSMAAAGLCAVLGGTPGQVENAAEIGMEHHLGLTCDPIGGLVQIPCIERNTMGAVQAVNAAKLALLGDGEHLISLDSVIATMRETGRDMSQKYKETSLGGLATIAHITVNQPAC